MCGAKRHVRSTLNSGHWQRTSPCPLCAKSGHRDSINHRGREQRLRNGQAERFAVLRLTTSSTSVSDRVAIFSRCYSLILSSIDPAAPEGSSLYSILGRVLGLRRPSQRSGHECLQDSVWHGFRVKDPRQRIPRAAPRPRFYFLSHPGRAHTACPDCR